MTLPSWKADGYTLVKLRDGNTVWLRLGDHHKAVAAMRHNTHDFEGVDFYGAYTVISGDFIGAVIARTPAALAAMAEDEKLEKAEQTSSTE
jgi:hypothetical protein